MASVFEKRLQRIVGAVQQIDYIIPPIEELSPYTYVDTPQAIIHFDALARRSGVSPATLLQHAARLLLKQHGIVLPTVQDYHEAQGMIGTAQYDMHRARELELRGLLGE